MAHTLSNYCVVCKNKTKTKTTKKSKTKQKTGRNLNIYQQKNEYIDVSCPYCKLCLVKNQDGRFISPDIEGWPRHITEKKTKNKNETSCKIIVFSCVKGEKIHNKTTL